MTENEIAKEIVDAAVKVHKALGPGLLESVYEIILTHEYNGRGLAVERQVPISLEYDGIKFDEGFRADVIVENKIILELKSVETIKQVYLKQLLTYLKLAGKRLGLLINFGELLLKNGIKRVVNNF